MFLIYSFIYSIIISILFLPEYLKRPKELRPKWVKDKFGFLPEFGSSIWVHAVSVGEVNASLPLLARLQAAYPDRRIILSTITDTGQKIAGEKAPAGTVVVYLPFDIGFILRRCFRKTRPGIFIIMETELWPNLIKIAALQGIPVLMINGRISEKSSRGYAKIGFFMKKILSFVNEFGMQSRLDAERITAIGADQSKVEIMGNLKFDMNISGSIPEWTNNISGPVLIAGSTYRGEDELILSAFIENRRKFPGLKLILAPRHPERFDEVADMLTSKGVSYIRRSALDVRSAPPVSSDVILLDTVGELSAVYKIASLAIIGKSFIGTGGQNPLEAAYWGRPVICGPHMENFPFIEEFTREGAAFQADQHKLAEKIHELLRDPERMNAAGKKAREIFDKNSDAAGKAMKMIDKYLT